MKGKAQASDIKRRTPRQARARGTIEAIFEATAQILQRDGPAALNTNRIAERAGVSIGSLYQYFPDKRAILLAMARRELGNTQSVATTAIMAAAAPTPEERARAVIRALIATFGNRHRVRRYLIEALAAHGLYGELTRPIEEIARVMALRGAGLGRYLDPQQAQVKLFVLTRAMTGVIRAALLEDSPFLGGAALEEELVALFSSYTATLRAEAPPN